MKKKMQGDYRRMFRRIINIVLVLGILCVPSLPAGAGIKIVLTVFLCVFLTIGCKNS